MKTVVVVNGETDWPGFLPGLEVVRRRLQESRWVLRQGRLWVVDREGAVEADGVLWRLGAVKPERGHRAVLEMIRLADIPCVNPASVLLRGYDRLSMLAELREAGLPTPNFDVVIGEQMLSNVRPKFPAVVKIGNFHGGFGKALVRTEEQWQDVMDLAFVTNDYATVEPYIDYIRDIRCLAVGDQMWGMSRRSASWKANRGVAASELIEIPASMQEYTERAMAHFGADVLGLDFLEAPDGTYVLIESNDIPGFTGFPDTARVAVADRLRRKFSEGP